MNFLYGNLDFDVARAIREHLQPADITARFTSLTPGSDGTTKISLEYLSGEQRELRVRDYEVPKILRSYEARAPEDLIGEIVTVEVRGDQISEIRTPIPPSHPLFEASLKAVAMLRRM